MCDSALDHLNIKIILHAEISKVFAVGWYPGDGVELRVSHKQA